MRKTTTLAVAALAAAALTLTACAGPAGDGDSTDEPKTMTMALIAEPRTFSGDGAEWANRAPYYQAVYDSLLRVSSDGEIEPWLATEWEYNDDQTVLTLTLREGVTFTDGAVFDAEAAVANLERFRDGSAPSASNLAVVESVVAVDAHTVEITLSAPNPAFLQYLSRAAGLMQSPTSFDNPDIDTNPVGSGPYILDTANTVPGSTYRYTANPDFWAPDEVAYDTLVFNLLADPTAQVNAINAGEADVVKLTSVIVGPEVEAAGWEMVIREQDWAGLFLLDRDGEVNPAIGDPRVRQAINYALDREALLGAGLAGNGTVTTQAFTGLGPAFSPELDERYPYDPDRARELLAEAGYADGFDLELPGHAIFASAGPLVQQLLGDVGIRTTVTDVGANLVSDILTPKFAAPFFILGEASDWEYALASLQPASTWNPFDSDDATINALLEQIQWSTDEAEIAALFRELNEYVVEEAWFAPFYRLQGAFAHGPTVQSGVANAPGNVFPHILDIRPAE